MLSESAVKRVLRKAKASGVLVVREVPEPRSYNGYALHFSVNVKKLEELKSEGREAMLSKGWLKPPKARATKGQKRPAVGKGTEGLQRPSAKGDCGPRKPLSGGIQRISAGPLTSNRDLTSYEKPTHTGTAPVASLPTPSAREANQRKEVKEPKDKKLKDKKLEDPPIARPPLRHDSPGTRCEGETPLPFADLVKDFEERHSFATLKKIWREVVTPVFGAENIVPLSGPDKENAKNHFIPYCTEAGISLPKLLRWCVEEWDNLKRNEMKWASLDPFPSFERIYALKGKLLPHYKKALQLQTAKDESRRKDEERRKKEAEERATKQERDKITPRLYKTIDDVPLDHPLRKEIAAILDGGEDYAAADHTDCVPFNRVVDTKIRETMQTDWITQGGTRIGRVNNEHPWMKRCT
jgi:hypothetical protein